MSQPTNEELLRMSLAGELPAELLELAAVSPGTLDSDQAELAERLRAVLDFSALLAEVPLEKPPSKVHRAALGAGRERGGLRIWLASLWTPPTELVPAFRGAVARPQTFQAGPFELEIARSASGAVVGELVPSDPAEPAPERGHCSLFGPSGIATAELGADGDFRFEGIETGSYRLVIDLDLASDAGLAPGDASGSVVVTELPL